MVVAGRGFESLTMVSSSALRKVVEVVVAITILLRSTPYSEYGLVAVGDRVHGCDYVGLLHRSTGNNASPSWLMGLL